MREEERKDTCTVRVMSHLARLICYRSRKALKINSLPLNLSILSTDGAP